MHESGWTPQNLAFIDMYGLGGGMLKDDLGYTHYPNIDHIAGSDAMLHHGRHFNADIIISLQDVWTLNPQDLAQVARWIPWAPIDYDPAPKAVLNNLRFANRIIAMSKFGQKQLQENGFTSTYIPHHVDTKIFYPTGEKKENKIKSRIDPNMFLFGMVSANKDMLPRKSFGHVLQAFKLFHDKHPNSGLYIHTDPDQGGGYPIRAHADFLGLTPFVAYPDKYRWRFDIPKNEMNTIYNSFDCLLSPSSTEGFCIPIIEAQATATPVIVNNYTSMPELIIDGETGFITDIGCEHFMPIGGYMKYPSVPSLHEKMEMVFAMNRIQAGNKARRFVVDNYSLDNIWNKHWIPYLTRLEQEIYPVEILTPPQAVI